MVAIPKKEHPVDWTLNEATAGAAKGRRRVGPGPGAALGVAEDGRVAADYTVNLTPMRASR
jgi:hypothetical protein